MAHLACDEEDKFADLSSVPRNLNFTFSEVRAHDSEISFPAVIPTAALESLRSPLVCTHKEHLQLCDMLMRAFAFLCVDVQSTRTQKNNTLIWLLYGETTKALREDFTKDVLYCLPVPDQNQPDYNKTQEKRAWLTLEDKARVMFYLLFSEKKKFAETIAHHGFLPDKMREFILCFPFHRQITRGMKTDDCFNDLDHLCAPDLDLLELFKCNNSAYLSAEVDTFALLLTLFFFAKHMCTQTGVLPLSNWYGAFDILFSILQDAPHDLSLFSPLLPARVTTAFANQPIRGLIQHKDVFLKYARVFSIFVRGLRVQSGVSGSGFEPVKRKANGTATKPWTNTYDSAKKDPLFHWLSVFFGVVRNIRPILRHAHVDSSMSWCITKMEPIAQTHAEYLLCSYHVMDARNQEQASVFIDDNFSWTRIRNARHVDLKHWVGRLEVPFSHKMYRPYYNSFVEETSGEPVTIFCAHRKVLLSRCLVSYLCCTVATRANPIFHPSLFAPLVVKALCTEPEDEVRNTLWQTYCAFLGGKTREFAPRVDEISIQHEALAHIAKEWKIDAVHRGRYEKMIVNLMTYYFFQKHLILFAPLHSMLIRLAKDTNSKSVGSTIARPLISQLQSLVGNNCKKFILKSHGPEQPFVVVPNSLIVHLLKTLICISDNSEIDLILNNWKRQEASFTLFPFTVTPAPKLLLQKEDLLSSEWCKFSYVSKTASPTQSYRSWESMLTYAELTIRATQMPQEEEMIWGYLDNDQTSGFGSNINNYKRCVASAYNDKGEFVYLYPDTDLVMLISDNNYTLLSDRCMHLLSYPHFNFDAITMRALSPALDTSSFDDTDTLGVALMSVN